MGKYIFSDDQFIEAVKSSFSIRTTLSKLGLSDCGGAYKVFHLRVKRLGLDISHFTGQGYLKNKTHFWSKRIPLENLLVENSDRNFSTSFKKRIIRQGLLKNKCANCEIVDTWQNKPIVLHVDHINGNSFDHRIDNLRLLCPNCHSQTETYCSKNKKTKFIPSEIT